MDEVNLAGWVSGAGEARHRADQLIDLIGLAFLDGVDDTALDVILEEKQPDLVQGRLDGVDLGQDIDAVLVFVDHARDSADLSLDAVQPRCQLGLVL